MHIEKELSTTCLCLSQTVHVTHHCHGWLNLLSRPLLISHFITVLEDSCYGWVTGSVIHCPLIFRLIPKLAKVTFSLIMFVRLSIHPSAWKNSDTIGQTFLTFDIQVFSEIRQKKFCFH